MKRFSLVAALALLFVPALAAQSTDVGIRSRTLPNGLEVLVIENHSVPLVTVELNVKSGAYTEGPEFSGLSHLYEHMFFKANRTIPSQEAYLRRVNQLGAIWNGTTSEERVNYYVTLGVDSLVPGLQFMEDAIRYPLFNQDELVRERPVVLGEFDRNEANPFFHMTRAVDTILWSPGYYTRKTAIGRREVITTATQEKMNAIKNRFYVPNNSALILAGDITPERGFQLAEQIFGDWPRGPDPFATAVPKPPALTKTSAVIVEQPVNGAALYIAWHGPSVKEDPAATYAADVLSTVLANPTSKFHKRLVDSGLTFGSLRTRQLWKRSRNSAMRATSRRKSSPRRRHSLGFRRSISASSHPSMRTRSVSGGQSPGSTTTATTFRTCRRSLALTWPRMRGNT
jgi:zinc protease